MAVINSWEKKLPNRISVDRSTACGFTVYMESKRDINIYFYLGRLCDSDEKLESK